MGLKKKQVEGTMRAQERYADDKRSSERAGASMIGGSNKKQILQPRIQLNLDLYIKITVMILNKVLMQIRMLVNNCNKLLVQRQINKAKIFKTYKVLLTL